MAHPARHRDLDPSNSAQANRHGQLTLDVWPKGHRPGPPDMADLKLTGTVKGPMRQLYQGQEVQVNVTDADGQLVASVDGKVQIGFEDKIVSDFEVLIRHQTIKLQEIAE